MLFTIQLIIILICLFYGARKGGIALGLLGGIGLVILVFVFHLQPGKPPVDVMLVIIAVVAASATLQASGGLDVMLQIAEKLLRRNPKYVSIVAPFVTCTLTILCGTGHVVYTILPIIYDVAIKNNIRPERPMAASSIGAQMGIIASPVSVAVVSLVAMLGNVTFDGRHLEFLDLLDGQVDGAHPACVVLRKLLAHDPRVPLLPHERLGDLDANEAFVRVGVEVGALELVGVPPLVDRALHDEDDGQEQGEEAGDADDDALIEQANASRRVLLTQDRGLLRFLVGLRHGGHASVLRNRARAIGEIGEFQDVLLHRFVLVDLDSAGALEAIEEIRSEMMLNVPIFCFGGDAAARDAARRARADRFFGRDEIAALLPKLCEQFAW